ncbi:toxin co-regulated pilus biosynthesis Q family protein, partial [bacterium]|nr:toxin co-regulated pilus biosynthesis Q family protein [bacterium]
VKKELDEKPVEPPHAQPEKAAAEIPAVEEKPVVVPVMTWTLTAGNTVGRELQAWGQKSGWKVIWNMSQDWSVPAAASFFGDFESAAAEVITTLAGNGALVRAQFFQGNRTMVVTGPGTSAQ